MTLTELKPIVGTEMCDSVLSILENVASHDREHAEQIQKTLATS